MGTILGVIAMILVVAGFAVQGRYPLAGNLPPRRVSITIYALFAGALVLALVGLGIAISNRPIGA